MPWHPLICLPEESKSEYLERQRAKGKRLKFNSGPQLQQKKSLTLNEQQDVTFKEALRKEIQQYFPRIQNVIYRCQ
jgi:hypothetical protein